MEEAEPILCVECAAEAPEGEAGDVVAEMKLEREGWDFTGEYGPRCPECVATNKPMEPAEGISQLADIVKAKKKV